MSRASGGPPENEIIPFADEAHPSLPLRQLPCRTCGELVGIDQPVCTACGHDRRLGHLTDTFAEDDDDGGPKCARCGYSLKGLPSGRCPECGTIAGDSVHGLPVVLQQTACPHCGAALGGLTHGPCPECRKPIGPRPSTSRERAAAASRADRRPLVLLIASAALIAVLSLALVGPIGPLLWLVQIAVEYPLVLLVFMVCWMFGVDVDESVKGAAFRLLAAVVAADAVLLALAAFPIPLVPFVASAMAFVGFLTFVFEMEWGEAMLVGFCCVIVKTIVSAALFLWYAGML